MVSKAKGWRKQQAIPKGKAPFENISDWKKNGPQRKASFKPLQWYTLEKTPRPIAACYFTLFTVKHVIVTDKWMDSLHPVTACHLFPNWCRIIPGTTVEIECSVLQVASKSNTRTCSHQYLSIVKPALVGPWVLHNLTWSQAHSHRFLPSGHSDASPWPAMPWHWNNKQQARLGCNVTDSQPGSGPSKTFPEASNLPDCTEPLSMTSSSPVPSRNGPEPAPLSSETFGHWKPGTQPSAWDFMS